MLEVKVAQSNLTLCNPMDCIVLNSPGQNIGVDSLSLLQGIFSTQGLNPGLPHCGQILYQLSHKGNPRILEWVAYPFSRGSSQPRDQTQVSRIAGGFFTNCAMQLLGRGQKAWGLFCASYSPWESWQWTGKTMKAAETLGSQWEVANKFPFNYPAGWD